jgi:hypothetical protein
MVVQDGREVDKYAPDQGLWPDVRRVLPGVLRKRTVRDSVEYQVRKDGRNGFVWVSAEDLSDVVVKAYEMSRGERAGTEMGPDVTLGVFDRYEGIRLTRVFVGVAYLLFKFVLTFLLCQTNF